MKKSLARLSVLVSAVLALLATTATAFAEEGAPATEAGIDVVPMAVWTFVGVLIAAVLGAVFYMLKRQLGLFDNPSWVAPISITPSSQFADEGTFGDAPPDSHGHH